MGARAPLQIGETVSHMLQCDLNDRSMRLALDLKEVIALCESHLRLRHAGYSPAKPRGYRGRPYLVAGEAVGSHRQDRVAELRAVPARRAPGG